MVFTTRDSSAWLRTRIIVFLMLCWHMAVAEDCAFAEGDRHPAKGMLQQEEQVVDDINHLNEDLQEGAPFDTREVTALSSAAQTLDRDVFAVGPAENEQLRNVFAPMGPRMQQQSARETSAVLGAALGRVPKYVATENDDGITRR